MTTTTLMLVVGCVVLLKTLGFIAFVVRRDRRQRRALDVVVRAARAVEAVDVATPEPVDPDGWRLQWAEPGVMLVQNTSDAAAARDVELSATLTASSGEAASVERAVRFVGTGACFAARFSDLEQWLADTATGATAALGGQREPAFGRLACSLSYSMSWLTPDGERRRESRTGHAVLPVPDLSFDAA